ncbi:MAG TPA: hypothetical protein VNL77_08960, partial [Roseiflexaceae bacterium]|nr:hypothetical protein [Roseiflexaceae bacterium]
QQPDPATFGAEPHDVAGMAPAAPQQAAPAAPVLVQVTATAPVPTMAPVAVTPTPPLTQAEAEERARRAAEAMRQSTQGMEAQMPGAP